VLLGQGHDYPVYAVIITANNLMFFGYLEATRKGPRIAPSLVRTMVLDERWRVTAVSSAAKRTEQERPAPVALPQP
jgi:hypothetical protein